MEKCSRDQQNYLTNLLCPFANVKAAQAANGGAYPPDMSVLDKS